MNLGEAGRVKAGTIGHWICTVCGSAKTPYAVSAELDAWRGKHEERCGRKPVPVAQTTQAEVEMLQFHQLEHQAAAINIGESLRSGSSRVLDMGPDDLELLVDPRTAQMDQLIRQMLELDGYTVIVIQSRELDDPQALRQHLRNIAQAVGRHDLLT